MRAWSWILCPDFHASYLSRPPALPPSRPPDTPAQPPSSSSPVAHGRKAVELTLYVEGVLGSRVQH